MQEPYSLQLFGGGRRIGKNYSPSGMAAVVVEIARRHTLRFKQQSILTTCAVFAKHCRVISASAFLEKLIFTNSMHMESSSAKRIVNYQYDDWLVGQQGCS